VFVRHRETGKVLSGPAALWTVFLVSLGALPAVAFMDRSLMSLIRAWHWPSFLHLMQLLTWLGYGAIDIGVLLTIALVGWWEDNGDVRTQGLWGAGTVAAAGVMDQVVKNVACRARPSAPGAGLFFAKFPCFPASYAYASFPSGHATTAFAAAVVLAFLYPRQTRAFLGLAVLVGLSRVVLGAHFPSDVLAGATLGTGFALAAARLVPVIRPIEPAGPVASP
jgi:membrane-associated phospholipid phosphatase